MIKQLLFRKPMAAISPIVICILFLLKIVYADNQIIPGNLGTADPAPMVDGETLYLYNTVDAIGNGNLSIYDIHCHSTKNLYHWKDEGVVLTEKNIPWAAKRGNLWAPHCIKLGRKYHLYFPANDGRTFRIGHAVSDMPTGPFIPDKSFMSGCGTDAVDPFAILDTGTGSSGKAYLAWNQVGRTPNKVYISELNSDYTDVTEKVHEISSGLGSPIRYKEGVWLVKQYNTWFCFIADWTGAVESISYSTSNSILGPYTKQKDILNQNTNSPTIHAGVVKFLNKWFIFYHTGGNEFGGTINSGTKRVTGIEEITFKQSGNRWTVPAVTKTYRGVGIPYSYDTIQIDRHSPSGIHNARISVVAGGEPRGWMVSNISNNGYIRYNNVDFSKTDKTSGEIKIRIASIASGGSIEVRIEKQSGTLLGTVGVPSTGGLTKWETVSAPVSTEGFALTGVQNLVLVFKTTVRGQYNINWIKIGKQQSIVTKLTNGNCLQKSSNHLHKISNRILRISIPDTSPLQAVRIYRADGREIPNVLVNSFPEYENCIITLSSTTASGKYFLSVLNNDKITFIPFYY